MFINRLTVKQFRCFTDRIFDFNGAQCVVITGRNGAGKSSLLEALHYGCYLRSFRTHVHKELVDQNSDYFFLGIEFNLEHIGSTDQLTVGFSDREGKVVRLNQKLVQSYKELTAQYRVITLTADDVQLIQGAPDKRRDFLNYSLLLSHPDFVGLFKEFKTILSQRNRLLLSQGTGHDLAIWSQKLWETSLVLRVARVELLNDLERRINELLAKYFLGTDAQALTVHFTYQAKGGTSSDFSAWHTDWQVKHLATELKFGRSFFGAHLDEVVISFEQKKARIFASRGQQKLIVFLLKVAQAQAISEQGEPAVLLLDDFLTDFDEQRVHDCLSVLNDLKVQTFLTSPLSQLDLFKSCNRQTVYVNLE